ncbi:MAG TPA: c-type cytochrome [Candidatus Sulfotelmatobacter sp.]
MTRKLVLSALVVCVIVLFFTATLRAGKDENQNDAKKNDADKKKTEQIYAPLEKAPRKAVNRTNPLEGDPEAIAAGGNLYDQHCAECHGETADGGRKGPSLRADRVQEATPGALFWIFTNGVVRKGMPVWSKLPEPQRWQLVSYIKSLTPVKKPVDQEKTAPPSVGDSQPLN